MAADSCRSRPHPRLSLEVPQNDARLLGDRAAQSEFIRSSRFDSRPRPLAHVLSAFDWQVGLHGGFPVVGSVPGLLGPFFLNLWTLGSFQAAALAQGAGPLFVNLPSAGRWVGALPLIRFHRGRSPAHSEVSFCPKFPGCPARLLGRAVPLSCLSVLVPSCGT